MSAHVFISGVTPTMDSIRETYVAHLRSYLVEMEGYREKVVAGAMTAAEWETLHRLAHNLSGSGRTFGFDEIGVQARKLVEAVPANRDAKDIPAHLPQALVDLQKACRHAADQRLHMAIDALEVLSVDDPALDGLASDTLFILASPAKDAEKLGHGLSRQGYHIVIEEDPHALDAEAAFMTPAALIVIQGRDGATPRLPAFMETLPARRRPPVVLIASEGGFAARLHAARLGAAARLADKAEAVDVAVAVENLREKAQARQGRHVLVIEDDEIQAKFYDHILQRDGIRTTIATTAEAALQILDTEQVDLILMDYLMAGCSGAEAARVIRQDPRHTGVPLVFMSADKDIVQAVRDSGFAADGLLMKPFAPEDLLAHVGARLQRFDELRPLMTRDAFTGLSEKGPFEDRLRQEIATIKRDGGGACLAVINIDRIRRVNDIHGHVMGDRIIREMARLMREQFRRTDVLARLGGDTFGVLMPGCTPENAQMVLEALRIRFADSVNNQQDHRVDATLSAGIAPLSPEMTMRGAMENADAALYHAKAAGRNQVTIANPGTEPQAQVL